MSTLNIYIYMLIHEFTSHGDKDWFKRYMNHEPYVYAFRYFPLYQWYDVNFVKIVLKSHDLFSTSI